MCQRIQNAQWNSMLAFIPMFFIAMIRDLKIRRKSYFCYSTIFNENVICTRIRTTVYHKKDIKSSLRNQVRSNSSFNEYLSQLLSERLDLSQNHDIRLVLTRFWNSMYHIWAGYLTVLLEKYLIGSMGRYW